MRWGYAAAALALFLVELAIALWVHDSFVRPFVGDVLVVVLIYLVLRSFVPLAPRRLGLGVLMFACTIEFLQAIDYVALLGVAHIPWLSVALGRTFSWSDLLAYTAGWALTRLDREAPMGPGI